MSNMQSFHKLLSATSENQDHYLEALVALTKVSPDQLTAMTRDLAWQPW